MVFLSDKLYLFATFRFKKKLNRNQHISHQLLEKKLSNKVIEKLAIFLHCFGEC